MADQNVIALTPVVAGAKVLSANDINSMIDADGSWEYGNSVAGDNWNKAIFDVFKSGTTNEVELAATYDYFVREKDMLQKNTIIPDWKEMLASPTMQDSILH